MTEAKEIKDVNKLANLILKLKDSIAIVSGRNVSHIKNVVVAHDPPGLIINVEELNNEE